MVNYQDILFPYAYHILGTVEDSKDAIQDVLLKYTEKSITPENEKNYLIKGVINRSLNKKRDLKKKYTHDEYWLPEPISTEHSDTSTELRDMISYSLLYLLEYLTPKERAVFILKEAFIYTHEEIAEVLSISIDNSRKLLSRANSKLNRKPLKKNSAISDKHLKRMEHFTSAISDRDLTRLHDLLTEEITFYADGGDKVKVIKKYCQGQEEVANLLIYVHHKYQKNYIIKPANLNYQPALKFYYREQLILCQVFDFDESTDKIKSLSVILDPEKLKNL